MTRRKEPCTCRSECRLKAWEAEQRAGSDDGLAKVAIRALRPICWERAKATGKNQNKEIRKENPEAERIDGGALKITGPAETLGYVQQGA